MIERDTRRFFAQYRAGLVLSLAIAERDDPQVVWISVVYRWVVCRCALALGDLEGIALPSKAQQRQAGLVEIAVQDPRHDGVAGSVDHVMNEVRRRHRLETVSLDIRSNPLAKRSIPQIGVQHGEDLAATADLE